MRAGVRTACRRRLVTAAGNAAEAFRGNIRGGTQLAGRGLDRDTALHRLRHMAPTQLIVNVLRWSHKFFGSNRILGKH